MRAGYLKSKLLLHLWMAGRPSRSLCIPYLHAVRDVPVGTVQTTATTITARATQKTQKYDQGWSYLFSSHSACRWSEAKPGSKPLYVRPAENLRGALPLLCTYVCCTRGARVPTVTGGAAAATVVARAGLSVTLCTSTTGVPGDTRETSCMYHANSRTELRYARTLATSVTNAWENLVKRYRMGQQYVAHATVRGANYKAQP